MLLKQPTNQHQNTTIQNTNQNHSLLEIGYYYQQRISLCGGLQKSWTTNSLACLKQ